MSNTSHRLLKLTLFYLFLSVSFLLIFQLSIIIAFYNLLPANIKMYILDIIKGNFFFGVSNTLSSILGPFSIIIIFELPFVLLGYGLSYLLFRKKYERKLHVLAATFSLLVMVMLGSYTAIKPMNAYGHKSSSYLSVLLSAREIMCNLLPKESAFNWTYPSRDQAGVSIHSPIVVNLKEGFRFNNSCYATYPDGRYPNLTTLSPGKNSILIPELSQDILSGGSQDILPEGSQKSISELSYLINANLDEIKSFGYFSGGWEDNTTIKVTCNYIRSGCPGSESFTFTVGTPKKTQ